MTPAAVPVRCPCGWHGRRGDLIAAPAPPDNPGAPVPSCPRCAQDFRLMVLSIEANR